MRIEDAVEQTVESRIRRMHVAGPGRVKKYDAQTRTVDIEPMIVPPLPEGTDEDDGDEDAPLPVLMNVPVMFPRAGGVEITLPVQAGDTMLIVWTDWDLGRWRASGDKRRPISTAKHGVSGAVAIPGLYPSNASPAGFSVALTTSAMEVGGNTDAAALASKVDALFDAFVNAAPSPTDGGAAIQAAVQAVWSQMSSTASAKLKLGG